MEKRFRPGPRKKERKEKISKEPKETVEKPAKEKAVKTGKPVEIITDPEEIKEVEKEIEVIDVSTNNCYQGVCNNLRLANSLITSSTIFDLKIGTKEYALEKRKNRFLEDISADFGMELIQFNLSEFDKINFWLSDLVLTLNNFSYNIDPF